MVSRTKKGREKYQLHNEVMIGARAQHKIEWFGVEKARTWWSNKKAEFQIPKGY